MSDYHTPPKPPAKPCMFCKGCGKIVVKGEDKTCPTCKGAGEVPAPSGRDLHTK